MNNYQNQPFITSTRFGNNQSPSHNPEAFTVSGTPTLNHSTNASVGNNGTTPYNGGFVNSTAAASRPQGFVEGLDVNTMGGGSNRPPTRPNPSRPNPSRPPIRPNPPPRPNPSRPNHPRPNPPRPDHGRPNPRPPTRPPAKQVYPPFRPTPLPNRDRDRFSSTINNVIFARPPNARYTTRSPNQCQDYCVSNGNCNAWSHNPSNNLCQIYNGPAQQVYRVGGATSGEIVAQRR